MGKRVVLGMFCSGLLLLALPVMVNAQERAKDSLRQLKAAKKAKRLEAHQAKKQAKLAASSSKALSDNVNQAKMNQNNEGAPKRGRAAKLAILAEIDEITPLRIAARIASGLGVVEVKGQSSGVSLGGTLGFGISANMPVTRIANSWRFQPEFNVQLAFLPNALPLGSSRNPLNYYALQLPLLMRYRALPDLHFFLGPSLYLTMDVVNRDGSSLRDAVNIFNVGLSAGMNYLVMNNLALELRYNRRFLPIYAPQSSNLHDLAPELINNSLAHNNIEVGLVYFFKRDKIIKDITTTNLADLYQDGDIFNLSKQIDPDEDSDGDGVPYFKDACPTEPGSAWNNGCPADNDRDGVPNAKDSCINIAGVLSNDGCPANDKDKDGIIDQLDACPDQKGSPSNNGCPLGTGQLDSVKSELIKLGILDLQSSALIAFSSSERREIEAILGGISFKRNKIRVHDSSMRHVRSLAAFIRAHKVAGTQFSIFAHTLSVKSNRYNRQISMKRLGHLAELLRAEGVSDYELRYEGRADLSSLSRGDKVPRTSLQLFWHKRLFPLENVADSAAPRAPKAVADTVSSRATKAVAESAAPPKVVADTVASRAPKVVADNTLSRTPKAVSDTVQPRAPKAVEESSLSRAAKPISDTATPKDTALKRLELAEARALALVQVMAKQLVFVKDKAQFKNKKTALSCIDKVAALMQEYPDLILRIKLIYLGAKDEKKLGKIAQSKADYLTKLLKKAGIDPIRIYIQTKNLPPRQKTSKILYELGFDKS